MVLFVLKDEEIYNNLCLNMWFGFNIFYLGFLFIEED